MLFDTVRLDWFRRAFFPVPIIHQKVAHAFRVLTASRPMKLNLMLQTWKLLFYVARFRNKNIIVWRTLAKIVEKIKVAKLTYFITPWFYSSNPHRKQNDVSQKLVFTVAVLLKENRSSFSKQLGINCTCEQIGLFLISTSGCGSHSWKLLESPICSCVQLIPNCFSNRPISYTNWINFSPSLPLWSLLYWPLRKSTGNWGDFKFQLVDKLTPSHERSFGHLTKYDAFKVNRHQVMDLKKWPKIHTNVSIFETASPKII